MTPPPGAWTPTFTPDEIEDAPRRFDHDGLGILVAWVDEAPRAVSAACLHKGASLEGGVCRDGVITCPSHWWRYDLRTGALQGSAGPALTVYPARVADGMVEVELPEVTQALSLREALLAHARGEDARGA